MSMFISIEELYKIYLQTNNVCTDTRKLQEGDLFFALKGDNFNGNKFAKNALADGASYAVIDDPSFAKDNRYLLVEDVLYTLQELSKYHRLQLEIPVIGITGSNGKTTTKELIKEVLSTTYKTFATEGNLNNHIGVPLSLLSIDNTYEIAIIEMGANHVGEIAFLCTLSQPSHGMITNIGKAHLDGFGGPEGVIKGKSELYHSLYNSNGVVFVNGKNELLVSLVEKFESPIIYLSPTGYFNCQLHETTPFLTLKSEEGKLYTSHLTGAYNFENMAAAICIGQYFDVPVEKAFTNVAQYTPTNNRSQIIKKGDLTILLDAYNANPSSITAAIDNFNLLESSSKTVVLGDMFELGEDSYIEHQQIIRACLESSPDLAIFCGHEFSLHRSDFEKENVLFFENTEQLKEAFSTLTPTSGLLLIKGSRGMKLETILE